MRNFKENALNAIFTEVNESIACGGADCPNEYHFLTGFISGIRALVALEDEAEKLYNETMFNS